MDMESRRIQWALLNINHTFDWFFSRTISALSAPSILHIRVSITDNARIIAHFRHAEMAPVIIVASVVGSTAEATHFTGKAEGKGIGSDGVIPTLHLNYDCLKI